MAQQNN